MQLQRGRKFNNTSSSSRDPSSQAPIAELEISNNLAPSNAVITFQLSNIGGGGAPSQSPRFEVSKNSVLYPRPSTAGASGRDKESLQNKVFLHIFLFTLRLFMFSSFASSNLSISANCMSCVFLYLPSNAPVHFLFVKFVCQSLHFCHEACTRALQD